jgi:type II secretory pathway pseudopilin PulG
MNDAGTETLSRTRTHESGFTLVEALTSIVILVFGLVAVTNLLIVAGNSSQAANAGSAAAAIATEQMEILKATPFANLQAGPGGGTPLDGPPVAGYFRDLTVGALAPALTGVTGAADNARLQLPGTANIRVRWSIVPIDVRTLHITVRAESTQGLLARRSRAEFTTIRACTDPVTNAGVCNTPPCCP